MIPTVLLVFVFMSGLCMAALGGGGAFEARRRRSWPVAKGTVVRTEVLAHGTDEEGNTWSSPHFTGVVGYRYAFQPTTAYRGGGGDPAMEGRLESKTTTSGEEAEALLRAYRVGDGIDVRYDPSRPSRSILGPIAAESAFDKRLAVSGLLIAAVSMTYALLR